MKRTIYHGSEKIIEQPRYKGGKPRNDYGYGFYCTESMEMAKEWAVTSEHDGYANEYLLNMSELKVLELNREYSTLHWLAVLLEHRTFYIPYPLGKEAKRYILENFSVDVDNYDIVTGYRADDSYFSFAQDFLNGAISYQQLCEAMRLGGLGEQIVLKSKRSFEQIEYKRVEQVLRSEWLGKRLKRDYDARKVYLDTDKTGFRRGDIYIYQILDEEMKAGDVRLQ